MGQVLSCSPGVDTSLYTKVDQSSPIAVQRSPSAIIVLSTSQFPGPPMTFCQSQDQPLGLSLDLDETTAASLCRCLDCSLHRVHTHYPTPDSKTTPKGVGTHCLEVWFEVPDVQSHSPATVVVPTLSMPCLCRPQTHLTQHRWAPLVPSCAACGASQKAQLCVRMCCHSTTWVPWMHR